MIAILSISLKICLIFYKCISSHMLRHSNVVSNTRKLDNTTLSLFYPTSSPTLYPNDKNFDIKFSGIPNFDPTLSPSTIISSTFPSFEPTIIPNITTIDLIIPTISSTTFSNKTNLNLEQFSEPTAIPTTNISGAAIRPTISPTIVLESNSNYSLINSTISLIYSNIPTIIPTAIETPYLVTESSIPTIAQIILANDSVIPSISPTLIVNITLSSQLTFANYSNIPSLMPTIQPVVIYESTSPSDFPSVIFPSLNPTNEISSNPINSNVSMSSPSFNPYTIENINLSTSPTLYPTNVTVSDDDSLLQDDHNYPNTALKDNNQLFWTPPEDNYKNEVDDIIANELAESQKNQSISKSINSTTSNNDKKGQNNKAKQEKDNTLESMFLVLFLLVIFLGISIYIRGSIPDSSITYQRLSQNDNDDEKDVAEIELMIKKPAINESISKSKNISEEVNIFDDDDDDDDEDNINKLRNDNDDDDYDEDEEDKIKLVKPITSYR